MNTPETREAADAAVQARRDRVQRAMIARLDCLLQMERHGGADPARVFREDSPGASTGSRLARRMITASLAPVVIRVPDAELERIANSAGRELLDEYLNGDNSLARRGRRNERLLRVLLIKGIFARGELEYREFPEHFRATE